MADINFDCSHCGQNLDAPQDMAGQVIACPACEQAIEIPAETPGVEDGAGVEPTEERQKSSTLRLDIPKDDLPPPPPRIVKIKRHTKG